MTKKLTDLLANITSYQYKGGEVEVIGIASDSRKVKEGFVFVAVKGMTVDGHDYINKAIELGASAVVGEIEYKPEWKGEIVYVRVPDTRDALGVMASSWFDNPSHSLKVVGITGTDGKTTTANILHHILSKSGLDVGLVSTISAKIGKKDLDTGFHVTSPDPVELNDYLHQMVSAGCSYAILEVTSHGLDQGRVAGIRFDTAVLTNITHEHIDYHKTFDAYREAKAKLFKLAIGSIVLNKDDDYYEHLASLREEKSEIISYSLIDETADLSATDMKYLKSSSEFVLKSLNSKTKISVGLIGDYNISNTLAAIGAAKLCGISEGEIKKSLPSFSTLIGRMEEIENDKGFRTIVDFAHTPNSLKKVLVELRKKTDKKLICVFGCAGRRDIKKREMMPAVSARLADVSIFTAEDPRDERVEDILAVMEKSASKFAMKFDGEENSKVINSKKGSWYTSIQERGEAIAFAIQKLARKGDIVVVCGKGHEQSMAYEDLEHPWSDAEFVKQVLSADDNRSAIILAGGKGTRFNSETPKNLHKFAGRSMLAYELENLRRALFSQIIVVIGFKANEIKMKVGPNVDYAYQKEQLGTGNAALCGAKIERKSDDIFIIYGDDGAFYGPQLFSDVHKSHIKSKATVTFVSVNVDKPHGFGRVVYKDDGALVGIVEEKDASDKQKEIKEVNDGIYVISKKWFLETAPKIKKKAQGEYLLTDVVEIALSEGKHVEVFKMEDSSQWHGINTPEQLKEADKKMRARLSEN